jgi:hypothetical protein
MKTSTESKITIAQVIASGHDAKQALHVLALCQHLDCSPDSISLERHDCYGLPVYSADGGEYAVGTDNEAQEAVEKNIADSVWAFNASFILSECGLPLELEDAIRSFQEKECESANDALLALVEKCCATATMEVEDGLPAFAESAISADGRGHFMSSYDGEENEETIDTEDGGRETLFIYRTN